MKKINYQLQDSDGNVMEDKQLLIKDGDKLIMQYDLSTLSFEVASEVYGIIQKELENDSNFFAIPKGIELQILSVKGE